MNEPNKFSQFFALKNVVPKRSIHLKRLQLRRANFSTAILEARIMAHYWHVLSACHLALCFCVNQTFIY